MMIAHQGSCRREVCLYPDDASLAIAAAERVVNEYRRARAAGEHFSWFLAGGSTPEAVYRVLAGAPYNKQIDWSRVHIFFGDERCVPSDHPFSNFRMARRALLGRVPLPGENIHRIQGELGRIKAAQVYESELRNILPKLGDGRLQIHLVMLGIGEDGHTASLFPGTPALAESSCWVAPVAHHSPPEPLVDRVTITYPLLAVARQVLFLVQGARKADIVARILGQAAEPERFPAGRVRLEQGRQVWLLDQAAGTILSKQNKNGSIQIK